MPSGHYVELNAIHGEITHQRRATMILHQIDELRERLKDQPDPTLSAVLDRTADALEHQLLVIADLGDIVEQVATVLDKRQPRDHNPAS